MGRFLASRLMKEVQLFSSQCRKYRYRRADGERAIAANELDRQFMVSGPNQVWCGEVTYIWAGNRWVYLGMRAASWAGRSPIDRTRNLQRGICA